MTEVYEDPNTGGRKGRKDVELFSAPTAGLRELGKVCRNGADKYGTFNYRKGYPLSLSLNAAIRHILDAIDGEDVDPDSGVTPLAHAAWHCLNAIQILQDHPEMDDRYKHDSP